MAAVYIHYCVSTCILLAIKYRYEKLVILILSAFLSILYNYSCLATTCHSISFYQISISFIHSACVEFQLYIGIERNLDLCILRMLYRRSERTTWSTRPARSTNWTGKCNTLKISLRHCYLLHFSYSLQPIPGPPGRQGDPGPNVSLFISTSSQYFQLARKLLVWVLCRAWSHTLKFVDNTDQMSASALC